MISQDLCLVRKHLGNIRGYPNKYYRNYPWNYHYVKVNNKITIINNKISIKLPLELSLKYIIMKVYLFNC